MPQPPLQMVSPCWQHMPLSAVPETVHIVLLEQQLECLEQGSPYCSALSQQTPLTLTCSGAQQMPSTLVWPSGQQETPLVMVPGLQQIPPILSCPCWQQMQSSAICPSGHTLKQHPCTLLPEQP